MSLSFATLNCRGVSNITKGLPYLFNDKNIQILFLQETWLAKQELDSLNCLYPDAQGFGASKINFEDGLVIGRKSGGVACLWKNELEQLFHIKPLTYDLDWMVGMELVSLDKTSIASYLFINVYLPYKCDENLELYVECLGKIQQVIEEACTSNIIICGDVNCDPRIDDDYGRVLTSFCGDMDLSLIDMDILKNGAFTYISDAWGTTSWIDHCLCSAEICKVVKCVSVDYSFIMSDHRPIIVEIEGSKLPSTEGYSHEKIFQHKIKWNDNGVQTKYRENTDILLRKIRVSDSLYCKDAMCDRGTHKGNIDELYYEIVNCLGKSCSSNTGSDNNGKHVPGWNDYVREWHNAARNSFLLWVDARKPRSGPVYDLMRSCRSRFKYALRHCKRYEESHRADAMAKSVMNKDFEKFWKDVKVRNNSKVLLPKRIDDICGETNITNMWMDCYKSLFNRSKENIRITKLNCLYTEELQVTVAEVERAIKNMSRNTAAGPDGLSAEHLIYASNRLPVLLSIVISSMFVHGYMPKDLIHSLLVPIVKNKCGLLTSKNNYRPIALANVITKVIERVILERIEEYLYTCKNQFGFKKKSSTDFCIYTLKELVSMYNALGSTVFCCFLDSSKAFDRVNHYKLMCKLRERGIPEYIVRLIDYWYANQTLCVKWGCMRSDSFTVTNGVRQGGVLSPRLFNLYMDKLSIKLNELHIGLSYGINSVNNLMFADDIVLISPSVKGLQKLINICQRYGQELDIIYNEEKSVTMCINKFSSIDLNPTFMLGNTNLKMVKEVKYLGHYISDTLSDEKDMNRQLRLLYCRSNTIVRKFYKCSSSVKSILFKAYCANMYCCSLWTKSSKKMSNSIKVAYNNSFRIMMNLPRRCSASHMFVMNRVPSFQEIIRKSCFSLMSRVSQSHNDYVRDLHSIALHTKKSIACEWRNILYTVT